MTDPRAERTQPEPLPGVMLGEELRAARERADMTLGEVACATRIPIPSLELLEAGRFDRLPGDVYIRGFLRSYASSVGFDADDVIARYAACGLPRAPVSSHLAIERDPSWRPPEEPAPPGPSRSQVALAVLVLVIVATLTTTAVLVVS